MSKYYDPKQLPKETINVLYGVTGAGKTYYENKKKLTHEHDFTIIKDIFVMFVLIIISTLLITTLVNKFYPQPTFREVCEANNGTYIDNNGRAGDSCIYNK